MTTPLMLRYCRSCRAHDLKNLDVRPVEHHTKLLALLPATGRRDGVQSAGSADQTACVSPPECGPAICQFREMVEAGCLVSYGVKRPEMYAMLAALVDKMLKGAKPAGPSRSSRPPSSS